MQKELVIIRGLPGSGKSTLAEKLTRLHREAGRKVSHYEADQYFMKDGVYKFQHYKLHIAHKTCANNVRIDLADKITQSAKDVVIVSNTFTTYSEVEDYLLLAAALGAWVNMIHCHSNFKSIHDVPEASIERMRNRMVTNEFIVGRFIEQFPNSDLEISHQTYSKMVK